MDQYKSGHFRYNACLLASTRKIPSIGINTNSELAAEWREKNEQSWHAYH